MKNIMLSLILLFSSQAFAIEFSGSAEKSLRENVLDSKKNPNNKAFIDYVASLERVNNMTCTHITSKAALFLNVTHHHNGADLGFSIELSCGGLLPNGSSMNKNIKATGDFFSDSSMVVTQTEIYTPELEDDYIGNAGEATKLEKKLLCDSIAASLEKNNVGYAFETSDCLKNKNIESTVVGEATLIVEGSVEFNAPMPRGKFQQSCSLAYVGTEDNPDVIQEAICE